MSLTGKPAPGSTEPTWMVVATTGGATEAEIIAGRLRSLGIPAMVYREPLAAVYALTIGLGAAKVLVPEAYYEAAMLTLEPEDLPWLPNGSEESREDDDDDDTQGIDR